jgi:hypothetical protein
MTTANETKKKVEEETPAAKKQRVVSDASRAAFLFNKLSQLDAEEKLELEQSPENIQKRFAERRKTLLKDEKDEVISLVVRMRGG